MYTIHIPLFWDVMSFAFYILVGGGYLPFQKVFMYVRHRELKGIKAAHVIDHADL
jgi:hypothetical protein